MLPCSSSVMSADIKCASLATATPGRPCRSRIRSLALRQILLIATLLVTACSANWPHDYTSPIRLDSSSASFRNQSTIPNITVAVFDGRNHPTDDSAQRRVGSAHDLFGSTVGLYSSTENSFADDIARSICSGLELQTSKCTHLTVTQDPSNLTKGSPRQGLARPSTEKLRQLTDSLGRSEKLLLITLKKWQVSVFLNTTIHYSVRAEVLDSEQTTLASVGRSGRRSPPRATYLNPAQNASMVAPPLLKEVLQKLLSKREIQEALLLQS